MLPYKTTLERIREGERVSERLNHHIQRYGLQLATCAHNVADELMGFHLFGDRFQLPDYDVRNEMYVYVKGYESDLKPIITDFLAVKKGKYEDYLTYMRRDNSRADQLALYLLARRFQVHLAIITKERVWYTFEGQGDFSDCDLVLVHKGGNIWKNTTALSLPKPLSSARKIRQVPSKKKKSRYELDPDYVPCDDDTDDSDNDSECVVKDEVKAEYSNQAVFPEPSILIDLIDSEVDEELPVIEEEKDSDETQNYELSENSSDDTIIYDIPPIIVKDKEAAGQKPGSVAEYDTDSGAHSSGREGSIKVVPEKHFHFGQRKAKKTVQCSQSGCDKEFDSEDKVKAHLVKDHGQVYKCSKCYKAFVSKKCLNRHMRRHDPSNLKFKCHMCNFAGLFQSELTLHLTGHVDNRPFQCHKCPKTYRTKGELTKHIQVQHSTDVWVKCSVCLQDFKGQKLLGIHMRTHEEPTFECDVCHKKFHHYQGLTYHKDTQKCTLIE